MMMVMLIAGIGLLLGGLLTVGLGIDLDLSFGNTLIQSGSVVACSGILLLGLWTVVRELKNIARRLGPEVAAESRASAAATANATLRDPAQDTEGFLFGRDQPIPGPTGDAEPAAPAPSPAPSPAPWHEETAARDRARSEAPAPAEAAPAVKPRRNLLFSSSSRKERERAEARTSEPSLADSLPAPPVVAPPPRPSEPPPATFEDAWPQTERPRTAELPPPPPRRSSRTPSTFTEPRPVEPRLGEPRLGEPRPAEPRPAETSPAAPAADRYPPAARHEDQPARHEDQPAVTVLKSGVVDGMAYSLYSDGSIEAQMPEGMMRFASIDELRAHLDQRP
jgi:hypothetical protein